MGLRRWWKKLTEPPALPETNQVRHLMSVPRDAGLPYVSLREANTPSRRLMATLYYDPDTKRGVRMDWYHWTGADADDLRYLHDTFAQMGYLAFHLTLVSGGNGHYTAREPRTA